MHIKYLLSFLTVFNFFYITAEIHQKHLRPLLSPERNYFCKEKGNIFSPSQCEYDIKIALAHYFNNHVNSQIPSISFQNKQEFQAWAKQQTIDTYLITYQEKCISCASLLAAIESRIDILKDAPFKIYKIDITTNYDPFPDILVTPTVWKINAEKTEAINLRSCFDIFIKNE